MKYLTYRKGHPYYIRRVPKALKAYDPRTFIKIGLKTSCEVEAHKAAIRCNEEINAYWQKLLHNSSQHSQDKFVAAVNAARIWGFNYYIASEIAKLPMHELMRRIQQNPENVLTENRVDAVLGGVEKPQIKLSEFWDKFWDYSKNKRMNMSADQIRKWKNPRILIMRDFINCIGDKQAKDLTREDTLKYQNWQMDRIEKGEIVSATANKQIIYLKTMIETVSDNLRLQLDIGYLFKKLILSIDDETKRLPFDSAYITDVLLNPKNLSGMNKEAKAALYAFSETGAGFSELVGLLPEDIILNHDIPHIKIRRHDKHSLKTKYRIRTIPLVGFALDAFKKYPNGFTSYYERPDSLSGAIGKYLRENKLLPSDQHSPYSLRHSFQDRLTRANAPDRVQADLMGHKFQRPTYGDGSDLKQKHEWMTKIQLKAISNE